MTNENVSYREWMMNLIEKPVMSTKAEKEFKKYLSTIKTERTIHPDTFLRAVFDYAGKVTDELLGLGKVTDELLGLGFLEPFGDGYVLKIKV